MPHEDTQRCTMLVQQDSKAHEDIGTRKVDGDSRLAVDIQKEDRQQ
jgi:hypothetical protein